MKKIFAAICAQALLVALLFALPASEAWAQNAGARITAADYFTAKDYPQTVNFPGGVTMTNMTYNTISGFRPFTMEVYRPPGNAVHPGVLWIHGGNWTGGTVRSEQPFGDWPGVLAALAAHGYVVASIDYRLSGEARFPAAVIDMKTAIRFMRSHAKEWNLDDTRIASWGASVGGYMAVMAGVTCGIPSLDPPAARGGRGGQAAPQDAGPPPSDCVQAVIDWSGFLVLEHMFTDLGKPMPDKSQEGAFLGCEPNVCPADVLTAANPMTYVSDKAPPFLIQHGDADTTLAAKQPQDLYNALRARNVPAEFVVYPGVGHMFILPGKGGAAAGDPVNDQAVLDKVEQFLDSTLPQKK